MGDVRYALVHTNGVHEVRVGPLPLERMRYLVGADSIDVVAARGPGVPAGVYLIVDDEGLFKHRPVNEIAGRLYYALDYPLEHRHGIRVEIGRDVCELLADGEWGARGARLAAQLSPPNPAADSPSATAAAIARITSTSTSTSAMEIRVNRCSFHAANDHQPEAVKVDA